MNTKINLQTILIVFMVCAALFMSTNAFVNAQEGAITGASKDARESEIMFDPVPGGPGFIMVSAFDFKPYQASNQYAYTGSSLYNPSAAYVNYEAGLTLPHGATITKVTLYYYDNATSAMTFYLSRAQPDGWGYAMAIIFTEGAQEAFRTVSQTTIENPIIDNKTYSYFLEIGLPANNTTTLRLMNVRIDYEYTSNLPVVLS